MSPPHLDAEALSRSLFASNTRIMELEAENERLRRERQMVLDCVNLYGDETLHAALDAVGWPNADGADR